MSGQNPFAAQIASFRASGQHAAADRLAQNWAQAQAQSGRNGPAAAAPGAAGPSTGWLGAAAGVASQVGSAAMNALARGAGPGSMSYLAQQEARRAADRERRRQKKQAKQQVQRARAEATLHAAQAAAGSGAPARASAQAAEAAKAQLDGLEKKERDHLLDDAAAHGEEDGDDDIYSNYMPKKLKEGKQHPDPVVETLSLAAVDPPDATYQHSLGDCVRSGELSSLQLETIVYANQRFNGPLLPDGTRAGFFLGDGAGVGKGRQIAALIRDFWSGGGRRILWISVSNDLRLDAQRDLNDVHARMKLYPKDNKAALPKGTLAFGDGVLFITYSLLIAGTKKPKKEPQQRRGRRRTAYELQVAQTEAGEVMPRGQEQADPELEVTHGSRLQQIIEWLDGGDSGGDCMIVLDECHKAKNLMAARGEPTSTGLAVKQLQAELPQARVLYSSATGASEPNNLAYMTRLGTFGYKSMIEMVTHLTKAGLGSLELFSMGLKATGTYLSRALSYSGAEFSIAKVDIDPQFQVMYDRATEAWTLVFSVVKTLQQYRGCGGMFSRMLWAAFCRFFRQMLIASKVNECARLALEAVDSGMCVVIGLQSTGEANTEAMRSVGGDEMDDFISAPKVILMQFLTKHFPEAVPDMELAERRKLLFNLFKIVKEWQSLPSAEVAAKKVRQQRAARAAAEAAAAERAAARAARQEEAAAANGSQDAPLPVDAGDEDDDEPMIVGEMDLDESLAAQREAAIRTGNFLDLTREAEVTDEALAAIRQEVEANDNEEAAARRATRTQERAQARAAELAELQQEVEDAQKAVNEAQRRAGMSLTQFSPAARGSRANSQLMSTTVANVDVEDEDAGAVTSPVKRPKSRSRVKQEAGPSAQPAPAATPAGAVEVISLLSDSEDETVPADSPAPAAAPAEPMNTPETDAGPAGGKRSRRTVIELEDSDAETATGMLPKRRRSSPPPDDEEESPLVGRRQKARQQVELEDSDAEYEPENDGDAAGPSQGPPRRRLRHASDRAAPAAGAKGDDADDSASEDEWPEAPGRRQGTAGPNGGRGGDILRVKAAERRLTNATGALKRFQEGLQSGRSSPASSEGAGPSTGGSRGRGGSGGRTRAAYRHAVQAVPLACLEDDLGIDARELDDDDDDDDFEDSDEGEAEDADAGNGGQSGPTYQSEIAKVRKLLLRLVESLELPANPLDQLTELMGGEAAVAEMTGRKGGLERDADGKVAYRIRNQGVARKDVNLDEKEQFMKGKKLIAIISEAASTGISLQADKRVANQRRRCHLTLELPWSADKAIQQFGRSHRSNQTSAPVYRILVTTCGGEIRFAASAAKRLQSLGALLKGDRRALGAGADLKEFDVENKYGSDSVQRIYEDLSGDTPGAMPGVEIPELPESLRPGPDEEPEIVPKRRYQPPRPDEHFYAAMRRACERMGLLEKDRRGDYKPPQGQHRSVPRFLNRLLGMPIDVQACLFSYFSSTMDATIVAAKTRGTFDNGIVTLKDMTSVKLMHEEVVHTDPFSGAKTFHLTLNADRGVSWEAALASREAAAKELTDAGRPLSGAAGFWIDKHVGANGQGQTGHPVVLLATDMTKVTSVQKVEKLRIQRPNKVNNEPFLLSDLRFRYKRVSDEVAKKHWDFWFDFMKTGCIHGHVCSRRRVGSYCTDGGRLQQVDMISGAVLPVMATLFSVVKRTHSEDKGGHARVMRTVVDDGNGMRPDGEKLVGISVTPEAASNFKDALQDLELRNAAAAAAGEDGAAAMDDGY